MEQFLLLTFASANYAMQCESVLKAQGIKGQIIPTPREITLSCGLSILSKVEGFEKVKELINEGKIVNKRIYSLEGTGKDRVIKELEI